MRRCIRGGKFCLKLEPELPLWIFDDMAVGLI